MIRKNISSRYRSIIGIAILAIAGFLSAAKVFAGPITNGAGNAPFSKMSVYQGVLSIVPADNSNVMEIGNVGRDIASSSDIYLRPGDAVISNQQVDNYAKFFRGPWIGSGLRVTAANNQPGLIVSEKENDVINGTMSTADHFAFLVGKIGVDGSYNPITKINDAGLFYNDAYGFDITPWSGSTKGLRIAPSGHVAIVGDNGIGADTDTYSTFGITRGKIDANSSYIGLTKSGTYPWAIGVGNNSDNSFIVGSANTGGTITPFLYINPGGGVSLGSSDGGARNLCFVDGTCRSTWSGLGGGASSLDAVLQIDNKTQKDIILGQDPNGSYSDAGAKLVITQALSAHDGLQSIATASNNTNSALYGENVSPTGWAGFFSGNVNVAGGGITLNDVKKTTWQAMVCPVDISKPCLGQFVGSSGTGVGDLKYYYNDSTNNPVAVLVYLNTPHCNSDPDDPFTIIRRSSSGGSAFSGASCGGAEYVGTAYSTPYNAPGCDNLATSTCSWACKRNNSSPMQQGDIVTRRTNTGCNTYSLAAGKIFQFHYITPAISGFAPNYEIR